MFETQERSDKPEHVFPRLFLLTKDKKFLSEQMSVSRPDPHNVGLIILEIFKVRDAVFILPDVSEAVGLLRYSHLNCYGQSITNQRTFLLCQYINAARWYLT